MDAPPPKAPGKRDTAQQDLAPHPFRAFVTAGAVTGGVSGLAPAASWGARSVPHQCTVQGCHPGLEQVSPLLQPAVLAALPNHPDNLFHSHLGLVDLPESREGEGVMQNPSQHHPVPRELHLPPSSTFAAKCQQWIQPAQSSFFSASLSHCWLGAAIGFGGLDVDPAPGCVDDGAQLHLGAVFPLPPAVWPFSDHSGKAGSCPATPGFGGQLSARSAVTPTQVNTRIPTSCGHLSPSCQRKLLPFASLALSEDAVRRWAEAAEAPGTAPSSH